MYNFIMGQSIVEANDVHEIQPNAVFSIDGVNLIVPILITSDVDLQNLRRDAHQIVDDLFDTYITKEVD